MADSTVEGSNYDKMGDSAKKALDGFFIPFRTAAQSPDTILTEEFFKRFLLYADKFSDQCCSEFALILRRTSSAAEIRATPTVNLSRQIRETVFSKPDKVLYDYASTVKQISADLAEAAESLGQISVLSEALKGAAVGQVAGGFGQSGKTLGRLGTITAAAGAIAKQASLQDQQSALRDSLNNHAFLRIAEYLQKMEQIPQDLMDYGCAKCFGANVDLSEQERVVHTVKTYMSEQIDAAKAVILDLQKREQERIAEMKEQIRSQIQENAKKADLGTNQGCGGCLVVIAILIILSGLNAIAFDASAGTMYIVIGVGIAFGGIFIYKKRNKDDEQI